MLQDQTGQSATTDSTAALRAFDAAQRALFTHAPALGEELDHCLQHDPGMVAALAVAGLVQMSAGRRLLHADAGRLLSRARQSLQQRGGTPRERMLVAALESWQEGGRMDAAATHLQAILLSHPRDLLTLKLAHGLCFMLGDQRAMLRITSGALPHWPEGTPMRAHLLGCHAFALSEQGAYEAAEAAGRAAVEGQPDDLWAVHAVAHVLDSQGRALDGLHWLSQHASRQALGFQRHVHWHAALFHLHLGQGDAALDIHDRLVWPEPSQDARDLCNAASLLWRLEAQGVPVGAARWDEVADMAERRIGDHGWAFADLHYVLALAGAGRHAAAASMLASMHRHALRRADTQAQVLRHAGLLAARGVVQAVAGQADLAARLLSTPGNAWQQLGGSAAQRDLLQRMAIDASVAASRPRQARALLRLRAAERPQGVWEHQQYRRLQRIGDAADRAAA